MSDDLLPVTRALLSVSDKTGLVPFARRLAAAGVELISTGGTAAQLREAGLGVRDVAEVTGFPEMMGGRIKTLHPMVHGGLLARRDDPDHLAAMDEHGIGAIDLLVSNLYPFEATVARGADFATCVENIDIGGPAMIRGAAKNHDGVAVITAPGDYERVAAAIEAGGTDAALRRELAVSAFARTAAYDTAVSTWLAAEDGQVTPQQRSFAGRLIQPLRYGENPHQRAAFYADGSVRPGVATAAQVQGKALSYNNINDTDAAFELAAEFAGEDGPAVIIVKHANPCGVATGPTPLAAYRAAYDCDRVSAFGGIVALNTALDAETATAIAEIFTEVVIAPGADDGARAVFAAKPNLRLLVTDEMPDSGQQRLAWRQVGGGFLVQDHDVETFGAEEPVVVTERAPTAAEMADLRFAWRVAKHVKSNAIVYAKNGATVGVGAGQMSRVDSARIAASKARDMAEALGLTEPPTIGSVVASDAFFPFADGMLAAADAGATAVIQPGGSMRDAEVIAAANDRDLAMVFTGQRHFRH